MDDNVLAAMARWPNVPDVYGWLSLSLHGQWRLHPGGSGATPGRPAGESIGSTVITGFIDRNYSHDAAGRWFFQNGPQRVFVRLDAAPYILRTTGSGTALRTHNGLDVQHVLAWILDDEGRLFAMTDLGPGMVAGRDLPVLMEALRTTAGEALIDALARQETPAASDQADDGAAGNPPVDILPIDTPPGDTTDNPPARLRFSTADGIPATLGFVRLPREQRPAAHGPA